MSSSTNEHCPFMTRVINILLNVFKETLAFTKLVPKDKPESVNKDNNKTFGVPSYKGLNVLTAFHSFCVLL